MEDPTTFDSLVKNVAGVEPEAAMIGETCGSYRIIAPLGAGGMGWVFLAEHTVLGSRAAVKVLKPTQSQQQHLVKRFFDEARAASRVADPAIVTVLDFGWHPSGAAYLVMEYLAGETLGRRIRDGGRLAPAQALAVIRQCAIAMAAAHARGIVHRDLKPDNIFIVPDRAIANERVKILDFGIAKLGEGDASHGGTVSGLIMGTPGYMSPEQCRGAGGVDHRTDIYALGCVLFFALTGQPPFVAATPGDLIAAHLTQTPPAASSVVPGLAPALDELVARCMAKNVIHRIQTMVDLTAAVDAIANAPLATALPIRTEPAIGNGPVVEPPTTVEGARSGRRFALLGSVVIAAAATLAIVLATRGDDDRAPPAANGSANAPGSTTTGGSSMSPSADRDTRGAPTVGSQSTGPDGHNTTSSGSQSTGSAGGSAAGSSTSPRGSTTRDSTTTRESTARGSASSPTTNGADIGGRGRTTGTSPARGSDSRAKPEDRSGSADTSHARPDDASHARPPPIDDTHAGSAHRDPAGSGSQKSGDDPYDRR